MWWCLFGEFAVCVLGVCSVGVYDYHDYYLRCVMSVKSVVWVWVSVYV